MREFDFISLLGILLNYNLILSLPQDIELTFQELSLKILSLLLRSSILVLPQDWNLGFS